jgi:hypothetical protein
VGTYLKPPGWEAPARFPKWMKISTLVALLAVALIILSRYAQIKALYQMYWSQGEIEKLFYED